MFPDFIPPMLATLAELPADDAAYAYELKWDGIRGIAYWDGARFRLESRNRLDLTDRYPEIAPLARRLPAPAVLDGEIVAIGAGGRPSFELLQQRSGVIPTGAHLDIPIVYMVFDLLYLGQESLLTYAYEERRRQLEALDIESEHVRLSPAYQNEGSIILHLARQHGLEGIMAKRKDSRYEAGRRSNAWLKIKIVKRQEFVVGGWMPGERSFTGHLGSLLLGYYERGRLRYAGNVGSGFSLEQRGALLQKLKTLSGPNPFADPVPLKLARFVRPELVADVEFRGWTEGPRVRQATFKGLRLDKRPAEVVREDQ